MILQLSIPYADPIPSNLIKFYLMSKFYLPWLFLIFCFIDYVIILLGDEYCYRGDDWLMRRTQYDRLSRQQLGFLLVD